MAVAEQNDRVNQFDMEGFCGVLRTDVRDNKDIVDMFESVALITKCAQSPYKKQWVDNPQCDIKTNRESRLYDAHNTTMDILATVWTYYCHKQYHLRFPNMWKIIRNEITHKIEHSHRVRTIRTDCGHIITYDAESNSTYDGYGYGIWWETE